MIVYNNQQLTGHCSFQEYSVLLQSPPRNNGNQGQHAIIVYHRSGELPLFRHVTLVCCGVIGLPIVFYSVLVSVSCPKAGDKA